MPAPDRGYSATSDQPLKRFRRVEGQLRGVQSMVEEGRYCIDALTPDLPRPGGALKDALGLMEDHTRHCVVDVPGELKEERTRVLMAAPASLMRPAERSGRCG